ncbi:hypothetical protein JHW45_02425 [Paracoccus stylophorae]|uniref:ApeA N-terminal domain-containing protein n=1 Tax=Paracoccus stylophorae TaxID=659350 RepID=A0ABY7SW83_9RHOB|nr:hypothetical protein [Paracoccus stylophorae]WCR11279.1 hypothetical protein JHW45_02425 [Paracoccus stylophorae]
MLDPEDFTCAKAQDPFQLEVDELSIGSRRIKGAKLSISYEASWRVKIDLSDQVDDLEALDLLITDNTAVYFSEKGKDYPIIITKASLGGSGKVVTGTLQREPLALAYHEEYQTISGILLSPPKLIMRDILLTDADGRNFRIRPFGAHNEYLAHISTESQGNTDHFYGTFNEIFDFFTFLKGLHCGIGHMIAQGFDGTVAARAVGFTRHDDCKSKTGWFDQSLQKALPDLFSKFSCSMKKPLLHKAIRQGLSFYRASNASRDVSIEMSIIASHSALEAITNYILEHLAGWSKAMRTDRTTSFCDKLRAAVVFMGVDVNILEHSPQAEALSRNRNMDAFEMISFIRNKIVHQDAKYVPKALELHETWLVMQWLTEVLILGMVGYEGEIVDRRIYTGWSGKKCVLKFRH